MKLILSVAAGVLLAGLLIWWMADPDGFRHNLWGYSGAEKKEAWERVQQAQDETMRRLNAELLEAQIRGVELRYGRATPTLYRMCHEYPPKTKEHQLECKNLDDRFARDQARDQKKHPW